MEGDPGAADTKGSGDGLRKQAEGKLSAKDLEEEKEKKRAMLAEARAKFLKSEEERLAREEDERKRHEAELRTIPVKFGSIISLRHETSRLLLASTNFKYYHTQTSGQHQIVAQAQEVKSHLPSSLPPFLPSSLPPFLPPSNHTHRHSCTHLLSHTAPSHTQVLKPRMGKQIDPRWAQELKCKPVMDDPLLCPPGLYDYHIRPQPVLYPSPLSARRPPSHFAGVISLLCAATSLKHRGVKREGLSSFI